MWVCDLNTNEIYAFDLAGHLISTGWGVVGTYPGRIYGPSQLWTDSDKNLYIAEVFGGRVQKFKPKKNARSDELVGKLVQ